MTETQITKKNTAVAVIDEQAELDELNALFSQDTADNTRKTYKAAWGQFTAFCDQRGREALPADKETVALFANVTAKAKSASTLRTYLAAIAKEHKDAGFDDVTKHPAVAKVVKAMLRIKKDKGEQQRQAKGMIEADVLKVLDALGDGPKDLRDAALITVARAGLTRRSELVTLTLDRIDLREGVFAVYRQKTGKWSDVPLTSAAKDALGKWIAYLRESGISKGRVFRSLDRHGNLGDGMNGAAVTAVFKQAYRRAGLDWAGISGHSARVGAVQDMTADGVNVAAQANAGGWSGTGMVVRYGSKASAKRGAMAERRA